jgi:DNA repair exonuclease SbcCD ATPase subunit
MSGIPSMLIDETIPFMNKRIMEYLEAIGGRYIVSFDTLGENKSGEVRDKITIRVLDTVTKANMRKQLSGGQTRIIDIATILTLSDLQSIIQNTKTNIILLDEVFDSLDDKNISYVSNLLRSLTKGKSTNIISHRAIDLIDCDEVLQLF